MHLTRYISKNYNILARAQLEHSVYGVIKIQTATTEKFLGGNEGGKHRFSKKLVVSKWIFPKERVGYTKPNLISCERNVSILWIQNGLTKKEKTE